VALLASQEKSEKKPHGRKEKCRGVGTRDALVLIPPAPAPPLACQKFNTHTSLIRFHLYFN